MDDLNKSNQSPWATAWWIFLLGTLSGFLYSVVILFITPKKYESTSTIQFRQPPAAASEYDERALANEAAILASPETMREVSQSLNLTTKWKMDQDSVVTVLSEVVSVEKKDGSDFFEVTVRHPQPGMAYEVAKAIPPAYATRKEREWLGMKEPNLQSYEAILVHGKAQHPRSAVFPNIAKGLWWGLGKGMIFGVVLLVFIFLFKKAMKGNSSDQVSPRKRRHDPADVW